MSRPRKGSQSRLTEFQSYTAKEKTNQFAGKCANCGRHVKAGDGITRRSPGMRTWQVHCGPFGCVDRAYHGVSEDPADREARLEHAEEMDNKRRAAQQPAVTAEELRMEHSHG